MSLCISRIAPNGHLLVSGDSRCCTYSEDGTATVTGDNVNKVRELFDGTVVYMSGVMEPLIKTISDYDKDKISSIGYLAVLLQKHTEALPTKARKHKQNPELLTALYCVTFDGSKMCSFLICNTVKDLNGFYAITPIDLLCDDRTLTLTPDGHDVSPYFKKARQGKAAIQ